MTTMPGCWMPDYPSSWHVIDEERGRIVCEILNRMQDPGDGSIHQAANITILTYAGDNLLIGSWARVAYAHETLTDEGVAWMDAALPGWREAA